MEQDNHSIWYKIGFIICWFLNNLPIFHISRDSGFDSVDNLTELRFSLLSFPLADKHIYVISYSQRKGIAFIFVLRLSDLQPPYQLKECEDKFLALNDEPDNSKSQLRIEFLKHKHAECQSGISTLHNKVNSYIAIALVYAGFLTFLLQSTLNLTISPLSLTIILMWIAMVISGINLINVLALLWRYLKVKGTSKSTFRSFKESPNWQLLGKSIYIDWLTLQHEKTVAASLVKNVEKYFIRSILISSLLLFHVILQPYHSKLSSIFIDNQTADNELILIDKTGHFSTQELLKLSERISPNKKIVFVYSSSNTPGKDAAHFIITALKLSEKSTTIELSENLFNSKMLIATVEEKK